MIEAMTAIQNPASFRDPRGSVYHLNGRVLRTVLANAVEDFEFVRSTDLIKKLIAQQQLVAEKIVHAELLTTTFPKASYILEHPRLDFISYPYEWPFAALKAAALLQLSIHLQALEQGVTLTDASAYNIQFQGVQPIFIDHLAFTRYQPGELWQGHRQFCAEFLNPLLLRAYLGVSYHAWYRGALEGISVADLNQLLPWYRKMQPKVFMHVLMQTSLQKTPAPQAEKAIKKINLPLVALQNMLRGLHNWIEKLQPAKDGQTTWANYTPQSAEATLKTRLLTEFVNATQPKLLYDLGCNNGFYSQHALTAGAQTVIGFDNDQDALDQAFLRAKNAKLKFLPLFLDLANPTPNQGWAQVERQGLAQRGPANALFAFAIVHHLAIGRNIPLPMLVNWLLDLAPQGLVEFVPKTDPMVQKMLARRSDIFSEYTLENFLQCFAQKCTIIKNETISPSGRCLIWYKKNSYV